MSRDWRQSAPAWLRHIYLCTSRVQYPKRREGGRMSRRLSDLLEGIEGDRQNFRDVEVRGVACDSREVSPGTIFVAINGTVSDGNAYIDDAIRRSCSAVVTEKPFAASPVPVLVVPCARDAVADLAVRFHGDPTSKMNVVGVTGTNGKTTTCGILKSIFEAAGQKAGLLGTVQHDVGGRVLPSDNTTPGADVLQRYFSEMVASGCRSAVMEVSSHALEQNRVRGVRFAGGIFTNLTRDHLDYHQTMEEYRDVKGRLFEALPRHAVAALNVDDDVFAHYARRTRARVATYGMFRKAEVGGTVELGTLHGTRMKISFAGEEVVIHTRLVGRHNAYNILGAAACAWAMGFDLDSIKMGVENLGAVPGRLEPVDAGQDFGVVVDYAHTDDALRNVLQYLKPLLRGRLFVVFGCGGDRDRDKRPKMGRAAAEFADQIILTSDNPRSENPMDIIREIAEGIEDKTSYMIDPDRRGAIRLAISMAKKDDLVLIAGKGHETTQVFRDRTSAFDDRKVAREALNEMVGGREF